jgi:osmoprotectant transport system permease protein
MNKNNSIPAKPRWPWLAPLLYLSLFLLWIFFFEKATPFMSQWLPKRAPLQSRTLLYMLAWQHLFIVVISTAMAILTSMILAVTVHLTQSSEFKTLVLTVSSIGETIPSAAVIALAVPVLGYGNSPVILALYLYAILPVVRNAIVGMESIPLSVRESGEGIGMTRWQQLLQINLPLSRPVLMAGIRTALVINISAATIGATVGAGGFGVPIIAGIRSYNPVMVIQGSVPVVVMALFADRIFRVPLRVEKNG